MTLLDLKNMELLLYWPPEMKQEILRLARWGLEVHSILDENHVNSLQNILSLMAYDDSKDVEVYKTMSLAALMKCREALNRFPKEENI